MGDGAARLVARFDGWTLWRTPLELFRGDEPVKLQEQPLQILEALLLKPGELVTREALTAHLWPDSVVDFEAGLNTAVRKLRAALADDAESPKYVETVPRQGYRFIGPIERRDAVPAMEVRRPSVPPWPPEIGVAEAGADGRPAGLETCGGRWSRSRGRCCGRHRLRRNPPARRQCRAGHGIPAIDHSARGAAVREPEP